MMPGRDGADAHVEDRVAAGGLALRPHSWTAVDGLPVEGWRAYVADRCEAAGVPYAFDVDLEHSVTAVVNPHNRPDDTEITDRIAELLPSTRGCG
ncbi:hypothetical protein PV458_31210 [Streptomyces sp. MN03-5084-2B]|nr:hypothetical protein [Streptomyces sp. MN03-5084-2B]